VHMQILESGPPTHSTASRYCILWAPPCIGSAAVMYLISSDHVGQLLLHMQWGSGRCSANCARQHMCCPAACIGTHRRRAAAALCTIVQPGCCSGRSGILPQSLQCASMCGGVYATEVSLQ
jgi:hypothetical protein